MQPISSNQRALLRRLQLEIKRGISSGYIVDRLASFVLKEKPREEDLDPQWKEIWDKYRPSAPQILAGAVIQHVDEAMQSIKTLDDEIMKIRVDGERVVFLLGAGASAPSGIPEVNDLLPELWKRAKKIGRSDLDKLAEWCDERRIVNIEDLLTAAYLSNFTATNTGITSLLGYFLFSIGRVREEEEYITYRRRPATSQVDVSSIGFLQDTLQTLFGLLTSTMISASPNPVHQAIVQFITNHPNTSIITTNYDGCMDEAILQHHLPIRRTFGSEHTHDPDNAIDLIKMHGSINWSYCESCQDVREFDLLNLKETYQKDTLSYPVIGICKNCEGTRRPLLVPPLSFKFLMFPNLVDIWNSARQAIEAAHYLIVVGYSFSEADTYITKIISRSMSMNNSQKMIIVNTNQNLAPTLRSRFSAHIGGFDTTRILSASQNAEEILPQIVNSMLQKGTPTVKQSPHEVSKQPRRTKRQN
jgi:NAD-dependent SIR2 family protein deacetylase